MRLLDIHTHFYPDTIAAQVVRALYKPGDFEACCDGTAAGLRRFMKTDGVTLSVNLPVATKKEQVAGINRRMIEFNRTAPGDILCFGTMHPEFDRVGNFAEEIHFLAENGVKGIKLHPEYQAFYPDDQKMTAVYEACARHGLVVLFHAGFDFPFPETRYAVPAHFKGVTKIDGLKAVFAHMGSLRMVDEVYKHLVGTNCWFDTAFTHGYSEELCAEIIAAHGTGRIVFGSDFPWVRASVIQKKITVAVPDPAARENIFWNTAAKLLSL